jgi:branched-subunit amino acid transport protein
MNLAFTLVPLAVVMWLVTYPSRAVPMLAPGIERLPKTVIAYLRLAGPAALASLAATGSLLSSDSPPRLQVGAIAIAVAICVLLTWRTRQLLFGVASAIVIVALARALGLG